MSVLEAYQRLSADARAQLIDVRTDAEWRYVGAPDLAALEKSVIFLPWQVYPLMNVSPHFVEALGSELRARGARPSDPLLFICRSGIRSRHAASAMTAAGWTSCFNVAEGFEGPLDSRRHRGVAGGWKAQGLPWAQT